MKKLVLLATVAVGVVAAAPVSAQTYTWTGGSNFDIADTAITPVTANYVQFFGLDTSYGEGIVGPMAHTHGQGLTWTILATVDGTSRSIYSQTDPMTGNDIPTSIAGLGRLSFAQGMVSSIGFTCTNCSNQTYHQFGDTTFTLGIQAGGVPEPATWALMILGFGATGAAMRRRSAVRTNVSFA